MPANDRDLVDAVLKTDSEAAFRQLFRRHSDRVFRVAIRFTADHHDAEDILQETWLRAIERLDTFRWRSSFPTWITGIAANVSREVLRRRKDPSKPLEAQADPGHVAPETSMIDLERAVASLPAGQKAAFILHDVEGMTHEEVARELRWSVGTSKSQLHRARRSLAERLGESQTEGVQ